MMNINKFVVSNTSFDPETLNLLSDAFEDAWLKIQRSGNRLARPGYANVMREVMAKHIIQGLRGIEWAKLGYEGARKLCIS